MSRTSFSRIRRSVAVVCGAVAAAGTVTVVYAGRNNTSGRAVPLRVPDVKPTPAPTPAPAPTPGPGVIAAAPGAPEILVYPPYDTTVARPVAIMLHGMCNAPERECPHFADSIRKHRWLVCPRADLSCRNGGAMWSYRGRARTVEHAMTRVSATYPGLVDDTQGRILMGFSLGALAGMDLAHAGNGKYRSVILIGAKVQPSARLLRRAGVDRVLLVAGDYDMMREHMFREAGRLRRQGLTAAFLSLGRVGHTFPPDMSSLMGRALAWATGDDTALEAG